MHFVRAQKTDEEWTTEARRIETISRSKIPGSEDTEREVASFYKKLVRINMSNKDRAASPNVQAASRLEERPQERIQISRTSQVATTSRVTVEQQERIPAVSMLLKGEGSQEKPLELSDSEGETTASDDEARHGEAVLHSPNVEDMYCVLCKTGVPALDVSKHTSSILHLLSKDPSHTVSQPLVPPTHYSLRSSNVGYTMLQRLGWTENTGLGQDENGRKAPIKALEKLDRKGVGVDSIRRKLDLIEEDEGRKKPCGRGIVKTATPLARNRHELEKSRRRDRMNFKAGLAYLNS